MNTRTRQTPPQTHLFLVERFWPGVDRRRAGSAVARLERAARHGEGRVRHLRSGYIPADEMVWSVLEADSADAVVAVANRAGYCVDRISETISVGEGRR